MRNYCFVVEVTFDIIALSAKDYKRIQPIDLIDTYAYGTRKDLECKKQEIKCNNIIKQYKKWLTLMILQKKTNEHNTNWLQIPDNLYRLLIIGGSGSWKTYLLFNLISHQPDIDKIYFLYVKEPYEAKYKLLINKEKVKD